MVFHVPFVTTQKKNIDVIFDLAGIKRGFKFYDLGSGDGRLVIEAARRGAFAVGIELSPFLVWYSRFKIKKLGLGERAKIIHGNFWNIDLSPADVIFAYLLPSIMDKLNKKFKKELKSGVKIISQGFNLPGWKPIQTFIDDSTIFQRGFRRTKNIFLYVKN